MSLMNNVRQVPSLETIKKWNVWLAVLYGLQAIAVLVIGSSQLAPLTTSFLTVDSLLSTTTGNLVLAPASHHLFDLNLLYVAFAVMVILTIVHTSQATWYRTKYEASLRQGRNDLRWLAYGLGATLIFVVLAVLSGVTDISMLLVLLLLGAILHGLCAWVEHRAGQRGNARNSAWFGYGLLLVTGLIMWMVVAIYLVGSNVFGAGRIPGRVYWLAGSLGLTALAFAWLLYRQIRTPLTGNRYRLTEPVYMILTVVTTSILVWQIVAGTMH